MATPWQNRESLTALLVHLFHLSPIEAHQSYLELGHQTVWAITTRPAIVKHYLTHIIPRKYRLEEPQVLKSLSRSTYFIPLVKAQFAKLRAENLARVSRQQLINRVCGKCLFRSDSPYLLCAPNPSGPDLEGVCADYKIKIL